MLLLPQLEFSQLQDINTPPFGQEGFTFVHPAVPRIGALLSQAQRVHCTGESGDVSISASLADWTPFEQAAD
jgi:hypothetical protein